MTLTLTDSEWTALEDLTHLPELGIKVLVEDEFQWVDSELIEEAWFIQGEGSWESLYSRGEVLLMGDRAILEDWKEYLQSDCEVQIHFRISSDYDWHHRFTFFVNEKGARWEQSSKPGIRVGLYDFSELMAASEERGEWEEQAIFLEIAVCNKSDPDNSLVHQIAQRWDIPSEEIDCSQVLWNIPYVKLTSNDWDELSELAYTYGAHLECGAEKRIVFAYSTFQEEENSQTDEGFLFRARHIYQLKTEEGGDKFRNDLRLKWHRIIRGERQQIWKYDDAPVVYGEDLTPSYPFVVSGSLREIQTAQPYIAEYRVILWGQEKTVIHAVEVDDPETLIARMEYSGELELLNFSNETYPDKALMNVECIEAGELVNLDVWGIPYYLELNRCCYRRNDESIAVWGRRVANLTGSYFTLENRNGAIQCNKWVNERLEKYGTPRKRYKLRTEMPLFPWKPHCRVQIEGKLRGEEDSAYAQVEEVYLSWKRGGWMKNRIVLLEEAE